MSSSALMTRSGGPTLANGSGDLSSSSSTSSVEFEREMGAKFEWVGNPAGSHGTYQFYKAFRFAGECGKTRILALGDFFLVRMWSHQDIVSIAELQLTWEDRYTAPTDQPHHPHRSSVAVQVPHPMASLKLYFLPENTPDGRLDEHGQDEVICISEKVVLKISDLLTWIVDDVKWERGSCPSDAGVGCGGSGGTRWPAPAASALLDCLPDGAELHGGVLDMRDVIKEKQLAGEESWPNDVLVLSYPAYCRYRAALKRLESCDEQLTRHAVLAAIGGAAPPGPNTRVVFCKDTFEYPELEDHELLCNHLAPKWKGRRARKGRKKRSNSPGSESNESESSVSTVTSSSRFEASKESPLKNGFRQSPMPFASGRNSADRPKGEHVFLQKLHKFMAGRGTPIGRLPSLGFKQLDLFLFYHKVQRAGGYEAAVANKLWKGIYIELGGHPSNTSAATCTRRHYEKLLLPYERHAAANGSADDHLVAGGVAGNGGSSASDRSAGAVLSPPKKRKLSDPSSDHHEPPPVVVAVAPGTGHPPEAPPVAHPQQPTDQVHLVAAGAEVKAEAAGSMTSSAAEAAEERPSAAKYPRIVESSIASAGPKIVDSIAPPPPSTATSIGNDRRRSSADSQRDDSADDSDAEVVILTPVVTSSSAPLTSSMLHAHQPTGKAPEVEMLKAEADGLQSNLTLQELMLGESMGSLADTKHSALSDLARIATKHKGSVKDMKLHPHSSDSVQITMVNKGDQVNSRPSVIQKSATASSASSSSGKNRGDPQPAHSQKPITLLNPPAELCQYYAQLLAESNKTGTPLINDPVGLSLTLGMNLRPPTPAAATPSIFVPTHRIFTDPSLDIKKNRAASTSSAASGAPANATPQAAGSIPPAHSKTAPVQGKPPAGPPTHQQAAAPAPLPQATPPAAAAPPLSVTPVGRSSAPQPHHPAHHHSSPVAPASTAASIRPAITPPPLVPAPPPLQPVAAPNHRPSVPHHPVKVESSIPLVDLTSRHSSSAVSQAAAAQRNADAPVKTEVNGKCLLDLSNKQLQQQLIKSPPSLKHSPWSSSPKASSDVSISVNVKVEGQESKRSSEPPAAAQAANHRHSVTVMPVVKDERHRTSKTSDKDRVSVTTMHHPSGYPRMVESLVGHSPSGSGMQNSSKMANSYYGSGSGPSKGSGGSSTSSAPAKSSPAAAESSMMYPHLIDPALASYYSSLYSPHNLYSSLQAAAAAAAANPFLAQPPPGFPPHMTQASASAAAEVTAQVYKDLVQRGYPPALAPGLPPHLGALAANIPGLGSLASYTSMYSSLGGKEGSGNGERSIPKS